MHPQVLAVTGPHATQEVMDAVHLHVPKPHDPFIDLVPEADRAKLVNKIGNALRVPKDRRMAVSGATGEGLREVLEACWKLADRAGEPAEWKSAH